MLFNSWVFLLFALLFFLVWPWVRSRSRWRFLTILTFSAIFYGWWDWRFLFLILASGTLDYVAGLMMNRQPAYKTFWLVASIFGNIGSLAVFKYAPFLAENLDSLGNLFGLSLGLREALPAFTLVLPVGISFYTFQSMSYTIDVYRGELEPTHDPLHFFSYLSMFPQLVAGPIVRAAVLLPQLRTWQTVGEERRWEGLLLVVRGYFWKCLVADNLAPVVNEAFGSTALATGTVYWWGIVSMFALQIYGDFSGYSSIARGLAVWMGYEFPVNFDHPYRAKSLREFWARWHISLSTWFRDYVYIALGGSHCSRWRNTLNLWVTMLLSGIWHGAAWTFVLWGGAHAFLLTLERLPSLRRFQQRLAVWPFFGTLPVLILVWLSWVLFRAESLPQAGSVFGQMLMWRGVGPALPRFAWLILAVGLSIELLGPALERLWTSIFSAQVRWGLEVGGVATLIVLTVFLRGPGSAFIYFQF